MFEETPEEKSVAKALNLPTQKLKSFMYQGTDELTRQILLVYPEATHLTVVNNDTRDGAGVPTLTTKQLRQRFSDITYSQGKRILNSVKWEIFLNVVCIVDGGLVYVKLVKSDFNTNGGSGYGGGLFG